jgi:hypothetical protein
VEHGGIGKHCTSGKHGALLIGEIVGYGGGRIHQMNLSYMETTE